MQLIFITIGSAVGGVSRYCLSSAIYAMLGSRFPYGTLGVNVLGCLLIGFLYVLMIERASVGVEYRGALIIGFLGSFTTFSAFSLDTLSLFEAKRQLAAIANVVLSCVLCLLACWLGLTIGRNL